MLARGLLLRSLRRAGAVPSSLGCGNTVQRAVGGRGLLTDSEEDEPVEVCFIDPRLVLEPKRLQEFKEQAHNTSIQPWVALALPPKLCLELSRGRFQLGDADDPQSHWYFGREGEVFQYKYCGSHVVLSGFSAAVAASVVLRLERGELPPGGPLALQKWEEFVDAVAAGRRGVHPPAPLLFAGRVLDCESAGVYRLEGGGGEVEGVMLSSEYESAG